MKTILGIGAHYDDCVFGISGILLKALRQHHRVVVMALIGDYSNWRPVQGREREIVDGAVRIARECGVEMRFLNFAEMKFGVSDETTRAVADAVADVAPDVALTLWPDDRHPDHEMAARLSKIALRYADRLIDRSRRFARRSGSTSSTTVRATPSGSSRTPRRRDRGMADGDGVAGQLMALAAQPALRPRCARRRAACEGGVALYRGGTCGMRSTPKPCGASTHIPRTSSEPAHAPAGPGRRRAAASVRKSKQFQPSLICPSTTRAIVTP